jgi:hypothetical protein
MIDSFALKTFCNNYNMHEPILSFTTDAEKNTMKFLRDILENSINYLSCINSCQYTYCHMPLKKIRNFYVTSVMKYVKSQIMINSCIFIGNKNYLFYIHRNLSLSKTELSYDR